MKIEFTDEFMIITLTRNTNKVDLHSACYGDKVKHKRFYKEVFVVITPLADFQDGEPYYMVDKNDKGLYEFTGEGFIFYDNETARKFFKEQNELYKGKKILYRISDQTTFQSAEKIVQL